MGRTPVLTDELKSTISLIKDRHPNWSIRDIQKKIPEFKRSLVGKVPGRTVIGDFIAKEYKPAKKKQDETGIDRSWHLGTLNQYPLPPEAVKRVLAIQRSRVVLTTGDITIRQAIWISRLYVLIEDLKILGRIAWHYAFHERISQISGIKDFDTSEYDSLLPQPKELLKRFESQVSSADYKIFKAAFGDITLGIEYAGPSLPVDHMLLRDSKIYGQFLIQGKVCQIELPYTDQSALLEILNKHKKVKSIKQIQNNTTVIRFKETLHLAFENKKYNEWLHNLLKES